jgi:hypothetical protein
MTINSNIQLENLQGRDSGISERITLKWIFLSVRDRASLIDVLNETNGCKNVEDIYFLSYINTHTTHPRVKNTLILKTKELHNLTHRHRAFTPYVDNNNDIKPP